MKEFYLIEKHFINELKHDPNFIYRWPNEVKRAALCDIVDLNVEKLKTYKEKDKQGHVAIIECLYVDASPKSSTALCYAHHPKDRPINPKLLTATTVKQREDEKPVAFHPPKPKLADENKSLKSYSTKINEHLEDDGSADCPFLQILDKYLFRHLDVYKIFLNNADSENFDLVNDFIKSFQRNCFSYVFYKTQTAAFAQYHNEIGLGFDESAYMKEGEKMEDKIDLANEPLPDMPMEDFPSREQASEKLYKLRIEFDRYLNYVEHQIFRNMVAHKMTYQDLSNAIGLKNDNSKPLTKSQIKRIEDTIQFRFFAFITYRDFLHGEMALRSLNDYAVLCKRYFGQSKLTSMPSKDSLRRVYHREDWKGPRPKMTTDQIEEALHKNGFFRGDYFPYHGDNRGILFASFIDFARKKHDHHVTYISRSGYAYCHVDGRTMDLFEDSDFGNAA